MHWLGAPRDQGKMEFTGLHTVKLQLLSVRYLWPQHHRIPQHPWFVQCLRDSVPKGMKKDQMWEEGQKNFVSWVQKYLERTTIKAKVFRVDLVDKKAKKTLEKAVKLVG